MGHMPLFPSEEPSQEQERCSKPEGNNESLKSHMQKRDKVKFCSRKTTLATVQSMGCWGQE